MRDIFKQFDIELSDQQENKLKEYRKRYKVKYRRTKRQSANKTGRVNYV